MKSNQARKGKIYTIPPQQEEELMPHPTPKGQGVREGEEEEAQQQQKNVFESRRVRVCACPLFVSRLDVCCVSVEDRKGLSLPLIPFYGSTTFNSSANLARHACGFLLVHDVT